MLYVLLYIYLVPFLDCKLDDGRDYNCFIYHSVRGASLVAQMLKNPSANAGDAGLIPRLGRSLGGGHGNPLQYSCLENPMDRGT